MKDSSFQSKCYCHLIPSKSSFSLLKFRLSFFLIFRIYLVTKSYIVVSKRQTLVYTLQFCHKTVGIPNLKVTYFYIERISDFVGRNVKLRKIRVKANSIKGDLRVEFSVRWTLSVRYIQVNVQHKSTLNAKIRVKTSPSILSAFISWWQPKKHLKRSIEGKHAGKKAEGINSGVVILGDRFLQDWMADIDCCN